MKEIMKDTIIVTVLKEAQLSPKQKKAVEKAINGLLTGKKSAGDVTGQETSVCVNTPVVSVCHG